MFQKVFDYPYLSASANDVFDITAGYASGSALSSSAGTQNAKKLNMYSSLAQTLMGHDITGTIQDFDRDGNIAGGGTKMLETFFLTFNRLLVKDEIKKGSFRMTTFVDGPGTPGEANTEAVLGDYGAASDYRVNSPAGDYGIIYTGSATPDANSGRGLLFYQAGVLVLTGSLFSGSLKTEDAHPVSNFWNDGTVSGTFSGLMTGSTIANVANGVRNRIKDIQFNNTTELNSTIYFIRLNHNEFNYSANPTYLSASKIRNKVNSSDNASAYFTGIGLYSPDNALMAHAKISEPIRKASDTEAVLRVRLDY